MQHTSVHDRVDALRAKKDPSFIAKLETGWVTLASRGFLTGHCVFFADPVVFGLNDLDEETRMKYWRDVCRVGDALIKVTGAYRVNYETLCNQAQALHTHIIPRQLSEPADRRRARAAVSYPEIDLNVAKSTELVSALSSALLVISNR